MKHPLIDLGFEIVTVSHADDGQPRHVSRFRCVECGDTIDLNLPSGKMAPEMQVKRAHQRGWKADHRRKNECFCPPCSGPKRAKPIVTNALTTQEPDLMAIASPRSMSIAPTGDQRMAIRNHLDKSFDDKVGCWLDGLSDQIVADQCNVPRLFVEQIREVGYGPIRVNPEIIALTVDISAAVVRLRDLGVVVDEVKAMVAKLSSRLVKITGDLAA